MRLRSGGCTIGALILLGLPAWAHADSDPARLAILTIILGDAPADTTRSAVIAAVHRAAQMRPAIRVIPEEEMFVLEGLTDGVVECGSDKDCVIRKLRSLEARLGLVVILNYIPENPLLSLRLVDTESGRFVEDSAAAVQGRDAVLTRLVDRIGDTFDKAGYRLAGRLVVEVEPPGAAVIVKGQEPDLGATNRFTLMPGKYVVAAVAEGFSTEEVQIVVKAGREQRVSVRLEEQSSGLLGSPWFWAATAGIVIVGATITAVALSGGEDCYCITVEGVPCPDGCQR